MSKDTTDYSIGSIHESNNYGPFEIVGLDHIDKYYMKYYKIRFLNTGYETVVQRTHIKEGNAKDLTYFNEFYANESIHESNNYGKYKILGFDHKDDHGNNYRKIKFLDTGFETVVQDANIQSGTVKDYTYENELYGVGTHHISNFCGAYTIIADLGSDGKNKILRIRFDETGYETEVYGGSIKTGYIKDPYYPSVYGIACIGQPKGSLESYQRDYSRWNKMIDRCYNPNSKGYYNYGAVGITVCQRWLCFEYYLDDIPNLPGYEDYLLDPDNYQLDKDIRQQDVPLNMKVYSPETCIFVHRNENVAYRRNTGVNNMTGYYGVSMRYDGLYEAKIDYYKFTRTIGVYENVEIAAGAYNWYATAHGLDKQLNPVRTITEDEVLALDLRKTRPMCYIVNK